MELTADVNSPVNPWNRLLQLPRVNSGVDAPHHTMNEDGSVPTSHRDPGKARGSRNLPGWDLDFCDSNFHCISVNFGVNLAQVALFADTRRVSIYGFKPTYGFSSQVNSGVLCADTRRATRRARTGLCQTSCNSGVNFVDK